jgi:peptidoglycan/xylan/chitin deacetylase (PgdA/CDA1 family)
LANELVLERPGHPRASWSTAGPREVLLRAVHEATYTLSAGARSDAMTQFASQVPVVPPADGSVRPMEAPEAAALASRPGHQIGSHTIHHLSLPVQTDLVCQTELAVSRERLARLLGRPPNLVAYPFGACDMNVARYADAAGYRGGLGVRDVPWRPHDGLMDLPRIQAPDSVEMFMRTVEDVFAGAP